MLSTLFPLPNGMIVDHLTCTPEQIVMALICIQPSVHCPTCATPAERIHSHYCRTVADVAWGGQQVTLQITVRKFFCLCRDCPQKLFAERFPGLVQSYARMTDRLVASLQCIGMAAGGKAGSRLAQQLAMPVTPVTLLRHLLDIPLPSRPQVRVLGVDDWAWKKGQRYGTILVDLERHRAIDLLAERTAEGFAAWLREHPEVEIICRDRGSCYIEGATKGAPYAIQIADRYHLLANLRETVEAVLARHRTELCRQAISEKTPDEHAYPRQSPAAEHQRHVRVAQRNERFEQVKTLHESGISREDIARCTGLSLRTVTRYLRLQTCPQYGRQRKSVLEPYLGWVRQRFTDGCRNAAHLYREAQAQGYHGTYAAISAYVRYLRNPDGIPPTPSLRSQRRQTYSPKKVVWWILKDRDDLHQTEQDALTVILNECADVYQAHRLAKAFQRIVAEGDSDGFDPWLEQAESSSLPEFQRWAWGLRQDYAAVRAALQWPWSSGQVEGQVNRLKTIKRQMYGRAGFHLLRRRVLKIA
jgi:transposase